jgi:hypothetical protein
MEAIHPSIATLSTRDGLAPQILVGFFFKGPQKKKKIGTKTKMLTEKKKKGHQIRTRKGYCRRPNRKFPQKSS